MLYLILCQSTHYHGICIMLINGSRARQNNWNPIWCEWGWMCSFLHLTHLNVKLFGCIRITWTMIANIKYIINRERFYICRYQLIANNKILSLNIFISHDYVIRAYKLFVKALFDFTGCLIPYFVEEGWIVIQTDWMVQFSKSSLILLSFILFQFDVKLHNCNNFSLK